jgi:hypothetical protein
MTQQNLCSPCPCVGPFRSPPWHFTRPCLRPISHGSEPRPRAVRARSAFLSFAGGCRDLRLASHGLPLDGDTPQFARFNPVFPLLWTAGESVQNSGHREVLRATLSARQQPRAHRTRGPTARGDSREGSHVAALCRCVRPAREESELTQRRNANRADFGGGDRRDQRAESRVEMSSSTIFI